MDSGEVKEREFSSRVTVPDGWELIESLADPDDAAAPAPDDDDDDDDD